MLPLFTWVWNKEASFKRCYIFYNLDNILQNYVHNDLVLYFDGKKIKYSQKYSTAYYLEGNHLQVVYNLDNIHQKPYDIYHSYHHWQPISKSLLQSNWKVNIKFFIIIIINLYRYTADDNITKLYIKIYNQ